MYSKIIRQFQYFDIKSIRVLCTVGFTPGFQKAALGSMVYLKRWLSIICLGS